MRMTDRELVLRFLAFAMKEYSEYRERDLDAFLNERMTELNKTPESEIQVLRQRFNMAMNWAYDIFGDHPSGANQAFRKRHDSGVVLQ